MGYIMRGTQKSACLGDLEADEVVFVSCVCGHMAQIIPIKLHHLARPEDNVQSLAKRMRCVKCGVRGCADVWITRGRE